MTETKRKTDAKISGLETELGAMQADRLSLYIGNLLVDLIRCMPAPAVIFRPRSRSLSSVVKLSPESRVAF
jgi:hypothetical protein